MITPAGLCQGLGRKINQSYVRMRNGHGGLSAKRTRNPRINENEVKTI
jgi:hypothetical protein